MQFKQYPSYKPSGVEWLGDVPEHWDSCNLKFISKIYAGGTPDRNRLDYWVKGEIPWINSGAVNQVIIKEPSEYITELGLKNSSAKYIPVNSLVMALAGQGKTKGMVAYTSIETTCNQSMAAIVPKNYHYKFLYYWLDSNYQNIRNLTGGDNRDGLNLAVLSNIPCPKISIVEQTQIVSFLDTETARIDNLIAKQEKLIELLEEQRKSIISHAVTKGLNPNAPMKDSGVEWLGEVPEHWIISRVKFNFRNLDSKRIPLTSEERSYRQGVYPYYGASGIIDYVNSFIFEEDLVLFSEDGANLAYRSMPIAFVAKGKYWVNNHAHILKPFDNLTAYWACVLESVDVNLSITGATQPKITAENLGNICISFPPSFEERLSINNYILEESLKIDTLILKQNQLIEKLKEYRSSIISHAVTGKIDVREFGA